MRWRWWLIASLIALSWLSRGGGEARERPVPRVHLPDDVIVVSVNCEQWERWSDDGHHVWRANFAAVIETDNGALTLRPGDVFENVAPELWFTIEWMCSPEYGAGIWDEQ